VKPALLPFAVLLVLGAAWGVTFPLNKIAVSEGYLQFGLIFWNLTIAFILLLVVSIWRRKWPHFSGRHFRLYLAVLLAGSVFPLWASFQASIHLPAGVVALLISLVPMFTFPIALAMGGERFQVKRLIGLLVGMAAVVVIVGPSASLPDRAMAVFVPLALIAPFFYGLEGNLISHWGQPDADPFQVMLAATGLGMLIITPIALASGQWISPLPPYRAPDVAILTSSLINLVAYVGYIWLVGRAGAVFAAQVAYVVTATGVGWSMLLLNESYSAYIWLALGLMFFGMFLVQPGRHKTDA